MSEQHIESQDISVAGIFQDFYVVPDYQREYVWETNQVEQLLADIHGELGGDDPTKVPEYFIGSIVVCPGSGGVLELIDGQQRMTTLFVTICAIRDHFVECGKIPPGALIPQIEAISTVASGDDVFRYRLGLQYSDSGDVLERIAESRRDATAIPATLSVQNILNAYEVARAFLRQEFGDDELAARAFYGYLTNKVKLIRIRADDVAKALKIFETINDRGVGLNAMDLLKNLLFMKASRKDFEKLKHTWKELQDTLFGIGEKPLRFLRYFVFSRFDVDILREDQIYEWFSKNADQCGYVTAPVRFAEELLEAARCYGRFFDGKDSSGMENRFLNNMRLLGGKAARQHLILLLAGRHLKPKLFDRLCSEVENLFFCYVITRQATRDFERNFAQWAREVRKVRSETDLQTFVSRRFAPAKSELAARFRDALMHLNAWGVQRYRLQYVLAKLTQSVEIEAHGETEGTRWLKKYVQGGFEIEHIYPQTPSPEAIAEFGSPADFGVAQRLGNLALVEKSINGSLGNRPYSRKRDVYAQSQLLLTRAIAAKPKVGVNTRIDLAVASLQPFEEWSAATIEARQILLTSLAHRVWDVPLPKRRIE